MAEITTFGRILDGRLELCRLREYHKVMVGAEIIVNSQSIGEWRTKPSLTTEEYSNALHDPVHPSFR